MSVNNQFMSVNNEAESYKLAYEFGLKTIDEQLSALRETRDRAGRLFSSAAISGGAGVGLAVNAGWLPGIDLAGRVGALVAMSGFILVTVTSVRIWWPAKLKFSQDPSVIVGSYIEGDPPMGLAAVHRELAIWLREHSESNRTVLNRKLRWFSVGLVMLVVEIAGIGYLLWNAIG